MKRGGEEKRIPLGTVADKQLWQVAWDFGFHGSGLDFLEGVKRDEVPLERDASGTFIFN